MITSKTFSKLIAERGGRGAGQLHANRLQEVQDRRAARMLRLKSTVDARVKG